MTPSGGLRSVGYRGLPDLMAVMRAGPTGHPEVSQADINDSDQATAQTIARMADLIRESCADPLMQAVAANAWRTWGRGATDPRGIAWGCWWACKHMMVFVQDAPALARMFGPHDALELLVAPAAMIRCQQMEGDCDDFTMMVCALLACLGVPFEILTVAASPQDPSRFSHVYARAVMQDGSRIPMDASHGKYPGWEVPKQRQFRVQVWNETGAPIDNQAKATWDGLHGYVTEPPMQAFRGFGHLRGLGCDCSESDENGDCLDPEPCSTDTGSGTTFTIPTTPSTPASCPTGQVNFGGVCIPSTSAATSGTSIDSAGTVVSTSFGPIGSSVGCAPGYVVLTNSGQCGPANSAQGSVASIIGSIANAFGAATTVTTCNAAGICTTAPANSAAAAAAAGSINSSYLIYGGLAIAAIAVIAMMSHK
jgi:hypothetical protein